MVISCLPAPATLYQYQVQPRGNSVKKPIRHDRIRRCIQNTCCVVSVSLCFCRAITGEATRNTRVLRRHGRRGRSRALLRLRELPLPEPRTRRDKRSERILLWLRASCSSRHPRETARGPANARVSCDGASSKLVVLLVRFNNCVCGVFKLTHGEPGGKKQSVKNNIFILNAPPPAFKNISEALLLFNHPAHCARGTSGQCIQINFVWCSVFGGGHLSCASPEMSQARDVAVFVWGVAVMLRHIVAGPLRLLLRNKAQRQAVVRH